MSTSNIFLRTPIIEDADFILFVENNPDNWEYSSTNSPYTRTDIVNLIATFNDLKDLNQVRYMIVETITNRVLGAVDVFEIDREIGVGEVGILIADPADRRKGIGTDALKLTEQKVQSDFGISKLIALVEPENMASIQLFLGLNYVKNGTRKMRLLPNAPYIQALVLEKWLKK